MAELMRLKREKTQKDIEEKKAAGPNQSDVDDRKARLLA